MSVSKKIQEREAMIRLIRAEGPISLSKAASLNGVTRATVSGWVRRGGRRADGSRVRLEVYRHPGRAFTSEAAVARFLAALAIETDCLVGELLTTSAGE